MAIVILTDAELSPLICYFLYSQQKQEYLIVYWDKTAACI